MNLHHDIWSHDATADHVCPVFASAFEVSVGDREAESTEREEAEPVSPSPCSQITDAVCRFVGSTVTTSPNCCALSASGAAGVALAWM
eukprot:3454066-Rhodomonas_salina.1